MNIMDQVKLLTVKIPFWDLILSTHCIQFICLLPVPTVTVG